MEGHESLEEDDVSWSYIGWLFEAGMLDEGILWNSYFIVTFDQVYESLVGKVEVQRVRVIKVILCDIDLSLINAYVKYELLL